MPYIFKISLWEVSIFSSFPLKHKFRKISHSNPPKYANFLSEKSEIILKHFENLSNKNLTFFRIDPQDVIRNLAVWCKFELMNKNNRIT